MTSYEDGIPERELTLQYKPLTTTGETDVDTPSVADGTEVKLFAESIKEVFQKEPTFTPIQKGPKSHYEGDKTLVTDTMKSKHKWEITAWVYSNDGGKHSLDSSILTSNGEEADITTDKIQADEFGKFIPLGDTGIKYGSESVSVSGGSSLTRGTDYEMNYSRGEIKFLDSGNISSSSETTNFGPIDLGTQTVINDDFDITYTFDASARNIANLLVRMSQLGNPFVMRLDKSEFTASDGSTDARDFMVIPKKVQINNQASKPDEYKIELELRKATVEI